MTPSADPVLAPAAAAPAPPSASRPAPPPVPARPTTLGAAVGSEWAKLTSLRSTIVTVALAVVLSLGITALLCVIIGNTWRHWDQAGRDDYDPVLYPLTGSVIAGVLMAVLAVKMVTGEYAAGMMRLSLTVTPRRGRLLAAKAIVVVAVNLVVGTVVTVGGIGLGQVILSAYGLPTARFGDGDTLRALIAVSAVSPVFPLIGMVLGFLVRSTAGAVTGVLGMIFAPVVIGSLLPAWWQRNIIALLPGPASDAVSIAQLDDSMDYLHPALAVVVLAVWLTALLGAAQLALTRRDA